MILEFFGPPGSGKTAIAKQLATVTRGQVVSLASKSERWKECWRFTWRRPFVCGRLIWLTFSQSYFSWFLLRHLLFRLSFSLALTIKAERLTERSMMVIIDEGLAQFFFSVYGRVVSLQEIRRYFDLLNFFYPLVFIHAPAEIRQSRMQSRGRVPRYHSGLNYQSWLKAVDTNSELLIQHLNSLPAQIRVEDSHIRTLDEIVYRLQEHLL